MKRLEKREGSAYDSRCRYKPHMPEPGTVVLKWTGPLGGIGLVLLLLRLKAIACVALGLVGTFTRRAVCAADD